MDQTLKFAVDVNTASGAIAINGLKSTVAGLGTETAKAGGMMSAAFGNGLVANISNASNIIRNVSSAISEITSKVSEFVTASNAQNMALKGLSESAKVFGQDQQLANKYAKELASDGLMKISSSAGTLKMLMASGFNISESMQLAKSFKDIGAFNNVVGNLEMAMYDVARGIKTGSIELIENIGFTQRLSSVMKAAGVDISAGIDITNNAAQRQALYNAIMAEGNKFHGNAAKLAKENAGAYTQLGVSIETAKAKIGDTLNIVLVPLARVTTKLVQNGSALTSVVSVLAIGIGAALIPALISATAKTYALATAGSFATGGLSLLLGGLAVLTAGTIAYVSSTTTMLTEEQKAAESKAKLKTFTDELKKSTENLSMAELQAAANKQQIEYAARTQTVAYMQNKLNEINKEIERAQINESVKKAGFRLSTDRETSEKQIAILNAVAAARVKSLETERNKLTTAAAAWEVYVNAQAKQMGPKTLTADELKAQADATKAAAEARAKAAKDEEQFEDDRARNLFEQKQKAIQDNLKAVEAAKEAQKGIVKELADTKLAIHREFNGKTKEEYLNYLKEMMANGETFSKTEQEIWDSNFEYVKGYTTNAGKAVDGYYRRIEEGAKKTEDTLSMTMTKGFAESALSGMESEIDKVLNYKRKRTNAEYALDKKLADSNYKASVKRINDELKAEKRGSDRYNQLLLERQELDNNYAKNKSELDAQQEADNLSGLAKVQAVMIAGIRAGIQAVASIAAAQMFKNIVANVGSLLDPTGLITYARATIAAALTYTAVSAFGGLFEQGGQVPAGALVGNSHKQGGIWINAEGGEYIMSRATVARLGVSKLDALNFGQTMPSSPKPHSYEFGGLVNTGIGFNDAKLDKMIALLVTNNQIAYNKDTTPIIVEQRDIDPKIVARKANKGNKDLSTKRRV